MTNHGGVNQECVKGCCGECECHHKGIIEAEVLLLAATFHDDGLAAAKIGVGHHLAGQRRILARKTDLEDITAIGCGIDAVVGTAAIELTYLVESIGSVSLTYLHIHPEKHITLLLASERREGGYYVFCLKRFWQADLKPMAGHFVSVEAHFFLSFPLFFVFLSVGAAGVAEASVGSPIIMGLYCSALNRNRSASSCLSFICGSLS